MAQTIGLQITTRDGKQIDAVHDSNSILIGSGPSVALRLEDADVSSIHAVIKVTPDGLISIVDLGSEAGTAVNGAAVSEAMTLSVGDVITLGGAKITITHIQQEEVPKAHKLAAEEATQQATPKAPEVRVPAVSENDPQETQVIRERQKPQAPAPAIEAAAAPAAPAPAVRAAAPAPAARAFAPSSGQKVIDTTSDLDMQLLTEPLSDQAKPTGSEHVLEIVVKWGDYVVDSCQVGEARAVTVSGRTSNKGGPIMGNSRKYDLEVDGAPAAKYTIAMNNGNSASVVVPSGAQVGVRKADGSVSRDVPMSPTDAPFAAKAVNINMGDRLVFKHGTLTYIAQYVRGNASLGRTIGMDWFFPRVFVISALVHGFFVVASIITPHTQSGMIDELFKNDNRFAQMILKAPEEEKKRKKLDLSGMKGGAKHKGDEGKFGKKDKPKKDKLASKAGAPRVDPNKREKDRKIAMNAGLLGVLKGAGASGAVSSVFGPGGLGTGINSAMGGLRGSEMGDAGGAGGLGTRGTGAGGGGNSLGIGGLGTHGRGRGTGGYGNIDLGGRGKGTTRVVPGRTIIKGSLSKQEIARVIRRNLARFKYCYEKQLNANPNLSGKIAVYFTIAPTGSVASAKIRESSMKNRNVESCVTKVMRSLKFPQPRGGGIVVVTYPFIFQST